jgi:hypothetical protein
LERRSDPGGPAGACHDGGPRAPAFCRTRSGSGPAASAHPASGRPHTGRRRGSASPCLSVRPRPRRPSALDLTLTGGSVRRTGARRFGFARDHSPDPEKNEWPPHLKPYWAIPPEPRAEFVAAREEGLAVYPRPFASAHPVLCMEETSPQLVGATRLPLPVAPGPPPREDDE